MATVNSNIDSVRKRLDLRRRMTSLRNDIPVHTRIAELRVAGATGQIDEGERISPDTLPAPAVPTSDEKRTFFGGLSRGLKMYKESTLPETVGSLLEMTGTPQETETITGIAGITHKQKPEQTEFQKKLFRKGTEIRKKGIESREELLEEFPEWYQDAVTLKTFYRPELIGRIIGEQLPVLGTTVAAAGVGTLVGGVPGGVLAGATVAFAMESGDAYGEARESGMDPEAAEAVAIRVGTVNAALEVVPAMGILKKAGLGRAFSKAMVNRSLKKGIARVPRSALEQSLTESGTEILQELNTALSISKESGKPLDEGELKRRLVESGYAGGLLGFIGGGGSQIAGAVKEKATAVKDEAREDVVTKVPPERDIVRPSEEVSEKRVEPEAVKEPEKKAEPVADAEFIGMQDVPGKDAIPLFNITKEGHPKFKSTVTKETLEAEGLKVPEFTVPEKKVEAPKVAEKPEPKPAKKELYRPFDELLDAELNTVDYDITPSQRSQFTRAKTTLKNLENKHTGIVDFVRNNPRDKDKGGYGDNFNRVLTAMTRIENLSLKPKPAKEAWEMTRGEFDTSSETAFHGTDKEFDAFDIGETKKWDKFGLWFTKGKTFAESFGGKIKSAKVVLENPKVITAEAWDKIRLAHAKDDAWFSQWRADLIKSGHDGLVVQSKKEEFAGQIVEKPEEVAAFYNSQVKTHKQLVQKALAEGKPVPPEVLKDYPELKAKPKRKVEAERKPQPKAKVKAEVKPDVKKLGDVTGITKAFLKGFYESIGFDQMNTPTQVQVKATVKEVIDEGLYNNAPTIVSSLQSDPRPLNYKEEMSVLVYQAMITDKYNKTIEDVNELRKAGELDKADAVYSRSREMLNEVITINEGVKIMGTQAGISFRFLQVQLDNATFTPVNVMAWARAAKGDKKLTRAEESKFDNLIQRTKDMQKQVDKLEKKSQELQDEIAERAAKKIVTRETKRKAKRVDLRAERKQILDDISKLGFRLNDITGVSAEGSYLVGKLAVNFIREGALTLQEVVDKVIKVLPNHDITPRVVYDALNARDPEIQAKAKGDTEKLIRQLKTEARLTAEIEDAEKGVFKPVEKHVTSVAVKSLMAKLRNLKKLAYKTERDGVQLAKILRQISEVEDMIDTQYRIIKKASERDSGEIAQAKQKLRDIRSLMNTKDKLADLQQQMDTKEFRVEPPKEKRKLPPELAKAKIQLDLARKQIRQAIRDLETPRWRKTLVEVITAPRALMATGEMSYALRQGMILSVRRPVKATKVFKTAAKAFFSNYSAERADIEMRDDPNQFLREKHGLYLSPLKEGGLNEREEVFTSSLLQRIPLMGQWIKAAERNMIVGLNLLRSGVFDEFVRKFPNATNIELNAYADYVNAASGRGDLKSFTHAAHKLSIVMFSPRYTVSRFQTPYKIVKYWEHKRVRNEIAKDFVAFGTLGLTVLSLAAFAGATVGIDPRESDFGKIVIGNTRIDMFAGMLQVTRLAARIVLKITDRIGLTGKYLPDYAKRASILEEVMRFSTYKLSPTVHLPNTLISGRDAVGRKVDPPEAIVRSVTPLFLQEGYDVGKDEGLVGGILALAGAGVGVGIQNYETKTEYKRRIKQSEVNAMRADGKIGKSNKMANRWNVLHRNDQIELVTQKDGKTLWKKAK